LLVVRWRAWLQVSGPACSERQPVLRVADEQPVLMVERAAPEPAEQAWAPVVRVWLAVLAELHSSSAQQAFRAQEWAADD